MKVVFTNNKFHYVLLVYFGSYILWNVYTFFRTNSFLAFLPISIESALLILILTHNHYTRVAILVWVAIFAIGSPALNILATVLDMPDYGLKEVNTYGFAFDLLSIIAGIFIVDYTRRTVVVQRYTEDADLEKIDN